MASRISTVFREIRKLNRDAREEGISMFVEFKGNHLALCLFFITLWAYIWAYIWT